MGDTAKDVRLHVTLDNGEHLFLPGEAVTLDADKADALIRLGYATPLHVAAPVTAQAQKKGQKKENHMANGSRAACDASSEESAQAEFDSSCMDARSRTPLGDE